MSRNLPGPRIRETMLQVMTFIGNILRRAREIFWRSYRCTEEIRGQTLTARHLVRWDAGKTLAITRYDVAHKSQQSVAGVRGFPRFLRESKKRSRAEAHIRTGNQELGERKSDVKAVGGRENPPSDMRRRSCHVLAGSYVSTEGVGGIPLA